MNVIPRSAKAPRIAFDVFGRGGTGDGKGLTTVIRVTPSSRVTSCSHASSRRIGRGGRAFVGGATDADHHFAALEPGQDHGQVRGAGDGIEFIHAQHTPGVELTS